MSFLFRERMLWRRFQRLCWESDLRGNRSSRTWCAQYRTFENNRSSASSTSSSAVITDYHRPDRAARRRNVSKRRRSAKRCQKDLNRTGGNHQDALVLRGRRLSSSTWNPTTSPWMKQLTWPRIIHPGDWCLHLVLRTPSAARKMSQAESPVKWLGRSAEITWMLKLLKRMTRDLDVTSLAKKISQQNYRWYISDITMIIN